MSGSTRMRPQPREHAGAVDLTAVVVTVTDDDPRVLVVRRDDAAQGSDRRPSHGRGGCDALPSGPLEPGHRTLDAGLRAWVEAQTGTTLGYVEQLYTFGDRGRDAPDGKRATRALSIGYLALVREAPTPAADPTRWQNWYRYFPWEDWRRGEPRMVGRIARTLARWADAAATRDLRRARRARLAVTFGRGTAWNDERVLDRYELLYEVGLVPEAHRERERPWAPLVDVVAGAEPMAADHRRILATAIGRLRGKIKYRPVVFELIPPTFTLLQLQRTVEALAGLRLHKQNFRRLVAQQGLVEETGRILTGTGGRPAREVRFRPDAMLERLAPGVRLPAARRTT
jgi:hypothetical protein